MTTMVTGGCGFIGLNFVRLLKKHYPNEKLVVLDSLTYAANDPEIVRLCGELEVVDIRDHLAVARAMQKWKPDRLYHFAAESHVCRSISGPKDFVTTNVLGTFHLLEEWRQLHNCDPKFRFVHVSTDEVFGELGPNDIRFNEHTAIRPRSPYAASKASSDLLALSYYETYGLPVVVVNCSNNFGPYQHDEKFLPKIVSAVCQSRSIPIYGDGRQVRDWIFVEDTCRAIEIAYYKGSAGERYCIGDDREIPNIEFATMVAEMTSEILNRDNLFHVEHFSHARPTDDRRYAIDSSKIRSLGWETNDADFEKKIESTISWFVGKYREEGRL